MRTIGAALLLVAGWHIWATPKSERDVIPDFGAPKTRGLSELLRGFKAAFFLVQNASAIIYGNMNRKSFIGLVSLIGACLPFANKVRSEEKPFSVKRAFQYRKRYSKQKRNTK